MPPIFSEKDKEEIRQSLLEEGMNAIKIKGIKKASIDEITKTVGIAKGTFYHFFASKQEFIMELIRIYQNTKLEEFTKSVLEVESIEIDEVFSWYKSMRIDSKNPLTYMTPADAEWLRENLPKEYIYDEELDLKVARLLLSKVKNVREGIDYAVVANIPKIVFLALEHKEELHKEALDKNIDMMLMMCKSYIEGGR